MKPDIRTLKVKCPLILMSMLFWLLALAPAAQAACASAAGDTMYNSASHVPQFCDGTNWNAMGSAGAGGGGCSNPAGNEGDMMYNSASHLYQFCGGTKWIAMGPAGSGTAGGLVGWWKLDEGSGTTTADATGQGNTGTFQNSPTWTTSGKFNDAVVFANASNNYIDIANPSNFGFEYNQPFSLVAWVYRTSAGSEGDIIAKSSAPTAWQGYSLWMPANGQAGNCNSSNCTTNTCIEMDLNNNLQSDITACSAVNSSALTLNAWHHIVATYSGSGTAAGINIYVDGTLQTPSTSSSLLGSNSIVSAATDLKIGTDVPSQGDSFTGTIDDVRVYNRALSATEVSTLYNGGTLGCGSPTGNEGDMMYNSASAVMQYCNGSGWVALGK